MPRARRSAESTASGEIPDRDAAPDDSGAQDTVITESTQAAGPVVPPTADVMLPERGPAAAAARDEKTPPALGAYALNALPAEERAAVAAEIAARPELQAELGQLLPVARLLQEGTRRPAESTVDAIPGAIPRTTTAVAGAPSAEALSGSAPSAPVSPAAQQAPATRVRTASPVAAHAQPRPERERSPRAARATPGLPIGTPRVPWLVAGIAAVIALGAALWALALIDRLDTRDREITALQSQVGELRTGSSARVLVLAPTADGVAGSNGTVYYAPTEGRLILRIAGLPALGEERIYQLWYNDGGEESGWTAAAGFRVNPEGETLVSIPGDFTGIMRVAISSEPLPGNAEPTSSLLMEGTLPASG